MLHYATIEKFVTTLRCPKKTDGFVLLATFAVSKVLRGMSDAGYITLVNFSCNLCRSKIARQVVGKIAYLILVSKHNCSAPMILQ